MGKVWHTEHFTCSDCSKSLQNVNFLLEEEKIFCEDCYQKNFAKTCHACKAPIVGVRARESWEGRVGGIDVMERRRSGVQ